MNDKTYADGLKDAAKVAEDTYCDPNWHDYYRAAGRKIAHEILALTPDKTNTSEATAIGAGEDVAQASSYVLEGDYRMAYLKMCEAYGKAAASPKPVTNTSVDPGVEGVREAKFYPPCNCEDQAKHHALCWSATIDHPIARSGMGIGEAIDRIRQAVKIVESDTLGHAAGDGLVIWTATGSWCDPQKVTIGDIRALLAALSPQQDQSR